MTESQETDDYRDLLRFIETELGFETGFYHDGYLMRRINSRMRRTDTGSYASYHAHLRTNPGEHEGLLDSLSIQVTQFFRNPEMWNAVRPVVRRLTDHVRRVRIWCTPCADGREPYSMAMLALDDPDIDENRIRILGTDINEEALSSARRGRYRTTRTTDIEDELVILDDLDRYFRREGSTYLLRDAVRDMVSFERHDLIRDEPPPAFDLVMCRNLLIYIDAKYKQPIFETLSRSVRTDGVLVIGMTETIPASCRNEFAPIDKRNRIYRVR